MTKALLILFAIGSVITGFSVTSKTPRQDKSVNVKVAETDTIKLYVNTTKKDVVCDIEEFKQTRQKVLASLEAK